MYSQIKIRQDFSTKPLHAQVESIFSLKSVHIAMLALMVLLIASSSLAAISTSMADPSDYRGQLDLSTELLTIDDGATPFMALQNRTMSPDRLGGVVLLTDANNNWIEPSQLLRLGLANQGWELMMAQPSADKAESLTRAQLIIDRLREQGNARIVLIATGAQAANAIELASAAGDLRLVLFNASSNTRALSDLETQMETLGAARTIDIYSRTTQTSEAAQRHKIAQQMGLKNYSARAFFAAPITTGQLNRANSKQILGAIKTLIIESEQNAT